MRERNTAKSCKYTLKRAGSYVISLAHYMSKIICSEILNRNTAYLLNEFVSTLDIANAPSLDFH